jgi:Peroxidase, family 2
VNQALSFYFIITFNSGNDYKFISSQFQQLYEMQPDAATANYDLSVLTPFRAARFQQSIEQNKNFFNGPFTGVGVQPAAYTFIYRFMANKSAENPEGVLNQEVLKSFFSVTGPDDNLQWTEGYEKIPDNWYKRAIGDEYTIPFFLSDLLAAAAQYPQFLSVGGNTGTTNSFTGVDLESLTGGVYNAQNLATGNNAICFAFQAAQQTAPDLLKGLLGDLTGALSQLTAGITAALEPLSCPQLQTIDTSQFSKYPGATGAY